MAIRFDAVGDTLDITTALPTNASFTAMCDALVISDLGAPAIQPLYMALNAALTHGYYLLWEGGTNGSMEMVTLAAGSVVDSQLFASRPVEGAPFCFYLKCNGTGANQFECGWRYAGMPWVTATADLTGSVDPVTTVYLGAVAATYYTNHRKQNLRVWNRPLSAQELRKESESPSPLTLNGLHSYFPLSHAGDLYDRGPMRRVLTRAGTFGTEYMDYKRAPKALKRPPVPYVAAAGGFNPAWARNANTIIQVAR